MTKLEKKVRVYPRDAFKSNVLVQLTLIQPLSVITIPYTRFKYLQEKIYMRFRELKLHMQLNVESTDNPYKRLQLENGEYISFFAGYGRMEEFDPTQPFECVAFLWKYWNPGIHSSVGLKKVWNVVYSSFTKLFHRTDLYPVYIKSSKNCLARALVLIHNIKKKKKKLSEKAFSNKAYRINKRYLLSSHIVFKTKTDLLKLPIFQFDSNQIFFQILIHKNLLIKTEKM